ncbi:hypothetical protein OUZ56_029566 [Daphnia magna]|uniref:Uncharacterized protein n=1 Tax=Daphnia magna TaxID=35525 RepID=A0ABR0B778_9CRUS|nr:hypothetical protein OUZ56_029566 [Daphnia magna]
MLLKKRNSEPTVEELQYCAIRLLREWVVESGVAHMHATRLLHILNDFAGMTFLPRTTQTLLGSIRGKLNFKEIPPGRYYHSGVEAGLSKVLLAFKDMGWDHVFVVGKTILVSVVGMTWDAPATSFILNIKSHNSFYACRKCTCKGNWSASVTKANKAKSGGRVTFPDLNSPSRTDLSFRQRRHRNHHAKNGVRYIVEDVIEDFIDEAHTRRF